MCVWRRECPWRTLCRCRCIWRRGNQVGRAIATTHGMISEFERLRSIYERTHEGSAPKLGERGARIKTRCFGMHRALNTNTSSVMICHGRRYVAAIEQLSANNLCNCNYIIMLCLGRLITLSVTLQYFHGVLPYTSSYRLSQQISPAQQRTYIDVHCPCFRLSLSFFHRGNICIRENALHPTLIRGSPASEKRPHPTHSIRLQKNTTFLLLVSTVRTHPFHPPRPSPVLLLRYRYNNP